MRIRLTETGKRRTFGQRLLSITLWWGIPMLAVELIGVPKEYWLWVVILSLPATALGVLVYAALESGFIMLVRSRERRVPHP